MKIKIRLLKWKARHDLQALRGLRDEYSCGANLAAYISSRIIDAERRLDETLDQLALLDPVCPKERCRDGMI